jgi:hypothetical protein
MWRHVAAGAAKAKVGGQDEIARQIVAVLEIVADDRKRHVPSPFSKRSAPLATPMVVPQNRLRVCADARYGEDSRAASFAKGAASSVTALYGAC